MYSIALTFALAWIALGLCCQSPKTGCSKLVPDAKCCPGLRCVYDQKYKDWGTCQPGKPESPPSASPKPSPSTAKTRPRSTQETTSRQPARSEACKPGSTAGSCRHDNIRQNRSEAGGAPVGPQRWPFARYQGIPYRFRTIGTCNVRGLASAGRAIKILNNVMRNCVRMFPADSGTQTPILYIDIIHENPGNPCNHGAPRSEQFGYNSAGENLIFVNTWPYQNYSDTILDIAFLHEFGHAVFDLRHEHLRADRNQYINPIFDKNLYICEENMDHWRTSPFEIAYYTSDLKFSYDIHSIMHAGMRDYAATAAPTVELEPGLPQLWTTGPREDIPSHLGYFDVARMRERYDCPLDDPLLHEARLASRKVVRLDGWRIQCPNAAFSRNLTGTGDIATMQDNELWMKCAFLTNSNGKLGVANFNYQNGACDVFYNLSGCKYTKSQAENFTITMRTNRILRTFHSMDIAGVAIIQGVTVDWPEDPENEFLQMEFFECNALCHLMPGVCFSVAVKVENGNLTGCFPYGGGQGRPVPAPSTLTAFIVQDWDTMENYNTFVYGF
ncbi:uncharacterized protein LOC129583669 [Paramacrobiotus metropolitanus]|uniref:uncharacterized protein LOC129583669 n=1 Tax=Paramacrobiotus metropolitanus TaxID=2943436 RepID=UPI0024460F53|nr:uncharacterized protein LOC129583669 [Paramacrobiotus metropolitanus]